MRLDKLFCYLKPFLPSTSRFVNTSNISRDYLSPIFILRIVEQWLDEYNVIRPYKALLGLSPYQLAALRPKQARKFFFLLDETGLAKLQGQVHSAGVRQLVVFIERPQHSTGKCHNRFIVIK
jgi:hypothetical protein